MKELKEFNQLTDQLTTIIRQLKDQVVKDCNNEAYQNASTAEKYEYLNNVQEQYNNLYKMLNTFISYNKKHSNSYIENCMEITHNGVIGEDVMIGRVH